MSIVASVEFELPATTSQAIKVASELWAGARDDDDFDDNPEYLAGQVQLIADLEDWGMGIDHNTKQEVIEDLITRLATGGSHQ